MRSILAVSSLVSRESIRKLHAKAIGEFSRRTNFAGFQSESHKVQTDDGYKLTVHRILPQPVASERGSVFLMHGLFRNSADFIASGPKIALAYNLSENGYDVWLGNSRGSIHSREHESISIKSKDFWNFSFHEIGLHDVSATLNYILDRTKTSKTFYVGHSQGCCSLLALLSTLPEYNQKITEAHFLTPSVFLRNATNPILTFLARHYKLVTKYAKIMNSVDISPVIKAAHVMNNFNGYNRSRAMKNYEKFICRTVGRNRKETQISEEALKSFQELVSPEVSSMQLLHFLQLYTSGKFQQFDHDDHNMNIYKSPNPPEYNLKNVTTPIHLYSASQDILIPPENVEALKSRLPNVQSYHYYEDWNHVDVMLGKNSREFLYSKILKSMNEKSSNKKL